MPTETENRKPDIMSMTQDELKEFVVSMGEKPFRAGQLFTWMSKGCTFDEMTNLSKSLRDKLNEVAYIAGVEIVRKLVTVYCLCVF